MLTRLPEPPAHIHFVGIGGIGMSGLARVLAGRGYHVTGSDAQINDQALRLIGDGIAVQDGHEDTGQAERADVVVVTAAVRRDNPELTAARVVIKRAELLGLLAREKLSIAVAGTHGKSTTSGMLVTALTALGRRPSYAIGAVVVATGANAAWDSGEEIVVEADEYDNSFLTLSPDIAIITNIEFDHPDLFTQQTYDDAFLEFVKRIRPDGRMIVRGEDVGVHRLLNRLEGFEPSIVTFGQQGDFDWTVEQRGGRWRVRHPSGVLLDLSLQVPGVHNLMNATAAIAALGALGVEPGAAAVSVSCFSGVGRRFEVAGECHGITVVDDYAHHPTEIRATLQAARERFPGRPVWAIFQPHTYSRTRALLDEFGDALKLADRVILLDVYAAREIDNGTVSARDLQAIVGEGTMLAARPIDVAPLLMEQVRPGDVVVTLGAGDITDAGPLILSALKKRTFDD